MQQFEANTVQDVLLILASSVPWLLTEWLDSWNTQTSHQSSMAHFPMFPSHMASFCLRSCRFFSERHRNKQILIGTAQIIYCHMQREQISPNKYLTDFPTFALSSSLIPWEQFEQYQVPRQRFQTSDLHQKRSLYWLTDLSVHTQEWRFWAKLSSPTNFLAETEKHPDNIVLMIRQRFFWCKKKHTQKTHELKEHKTKQKQEERN